MNGYNGIARPAVGMEVIVPVAGSKTSGTVCDEAKNGPYGPPVVIAIAGYDSTRPFGSVVVVGYQRPRAMIGPRVHEPAAGFRSAVSRMPTYGAKWPPATNTRPSGSST